MRRIIILCAGIFLALAAQAADVVLANLGGGSSVVTNTITNALVWRTGQTNSYATGDDGDLRSGAEWPVPRFSVLTNTNCVRDNLTGLIWARNAGLAPAYWGVAITNCNNLDYGGKQDWRLPNLSELYSLVDFSVSSPALMAGHPFNGVANNFYYTSTTRQDYQGERFYAIGLLRGTLTDFVGAFNAYNYWPVRGPDPSAE